MERNSCKYDKFRRDVLERDTCVCQLCGADGDETSLHVHHIEKYSENENLRTDVENGITLCEFCHSQTLGKENQFEQIFKEILKNPIWRKKIIIEDKNLQYKDYDKLDKNENAFYLISTMIKYIKDIYAFKVYCYLCSTFDYGLGYSTRTLKTIAEECNIARSTVQKAIKYLEEKGFIIVYKKKKSELMNNCYYIRYVEETEEDKVREQK